MWQTAAAPDPAGSRPGTTPEVNEAGLETALAAIERVRAWSPRVVSRLEHLVRAAPDEDLFRVNPLRWAADRGVDEYEAVDLFLHSARAGLFLMDWNLICACCGKVMHSLRTLHGLQAQNSCPVCFRRERATLDDLVQVTFTISPAVRQIRFHEPLGLSLDEYFMPFLYEPTARLAGTLKPQDAMRLFRRHLSPFSPGERVTVETTLEVGILSCVDLVSQESIGLVATGDPVSDPQRLEITLTDEGFQVPLPTMDPGEFSVGPFEYEGRFHAVRPGPITLEFEQRGNADAVLAVIFFATFGLAADFQLPDDIDFQMTSLTTLFAEPRLTVKRLFATQTFHDLFRAEVFRESEGFGVKDVTVLFTDLKGSTQLYQHEGDLNAYALVREHYGILSRAVAQNHGAVIKTIGDAIMATFDRPADAVAAGLEMLRQLPRMNESAVHGDLVLKVGIHHGAAISVTLNDRVDYFGQTVNIASRVQGSADGDEMLLTREMYSAEGVAQLLEASGCRVTASQADLRGIDEAVAVYRVSIVA